MRIRSYDKEGRRKWHEWFAWKPVRVSHKETRWLEKVFRRRVAGRAAYGYAKPDGAWEYISHQQGLIILLDESKNEQNG